MVSIIIINYKQKDFLLKCVESIFDKIKSCPFEVVIVNNSSEEDLSNIVNKFEVRLLMNENKGFSQANNLGAEHANGEYLFFLNPDTIIQNDFLGNTIEYFREKKFGVVGFRLLNNDNTFQVSFGHHISIINEIKNKKLESINRIKDHVELSKIEKNYSEIRTVNWVSGAAILIMKETFNLIGGFDKRYFLYMEDADICRRISDRGLKVFYYPFAKIIHFKGENVKQDFRKSTYYYAKESQLLYYQIHNGLIQNISIKIYLFVKFLFLSLITFNDTSIKILMMVFKSMINLRYKAKK